MTDGPWISLPNGDIDYLSSIFYLVNSIQEYDCTDLDKYGRFKYENSLQKKWGVTHRNLVWEYIQAFCEKYDIEYDKSPVNKCYLTHDIDFIYSGWKTEGLWAIRKANLLSGLKILFNKLSGSPIYSNIKEIIDRENKLGFQSTFFWITQKGRCDKNIKNSDYDINDSLVQKMISYSASKGASHGLHKSTLPISFQREMRDIEVRSNRYHFLKFTLPDAYDEIEKAGLKIDTSLGFAEHFGYRNSYGLPFRPYNLKEDRPYNFIEVPLNIMDGTLINYMNIKQKDVYDKLWKWIEEVREHTMITILWHNNELTNYSFKTMSQCYDKLLSQMSKHNMVSISEDELIDKYLA